MISKPAWLTSEVGINKGMKTHFQPKKKEKKETHFQPRKEREKNKILTKRKRTKRRSLPRKKANFEIFPFTFINFHLSAPIG